MHAYTQLHKSREQLQVSLANKRLFCNTDRWAGACGEKEEIRRDSKYLCVCVYFCVQEGESEDKAIKEGKVTLEEGLEGMMLDFRIHYKLILFS